MVILFCYGVVTVFSLAGAEGIEPPIILLERIVLPLHYAPM